MYIPRNKKRKKNLILQSESVSSQVINSSVVDIAGSEISYTPETNSSFVVYEFSIQFHDDPDIYNLCYYELQKNSGTGYVPLGQGFRLNMQHNLAYTQSMLSGKFILNSWTGSNDLKMSIRALNDSYEITLHEDEAGNHFDPIIKVYSLM